MQNKHWEVGSEFHWPGVPKGPFLKWPESHIMLFSGRVSVLKIWKSVKDQFSKTLFIPDYFCPEVANWWTKHGIAVKRYSDGPHLAHPVWETIAAAKGDAVLSVNYFGVRHRNMWQGWQESNPNILLIEDHSHDPVSDWAYHSTADFAFSSLRKTFSVPDGAILWSPKGKKIYAETDESEWQGSALKLAAMILKKDYLTSDDDRIKEIFRSFQVKGEALLGRSGNVAISPWSDALLSFGYPIEWRKKRERNVRLFLDLFNKSRIAKPLFTKWPIDHCPFNVILLFPSHAVREKYRAGLIQAHIYPSVHWGLDDTHSADSRDVSDRIMTIPVDQRYDENDVYRVIETMLNIGV